MGCGSSKASLQTVGTNIKEGVEVLNPLNLLTHGDPKSRCNVMLREIGVTVTKIKGAEKELKTLVKAAEGALDASRQVLDSLLPNIYTDDEAANAVSKPNELVGGPSYNPDVVLAARNDLTSRMQAGVFGPLEAWVKTYNDALTSQKLLDKAYDELEAQKKRLEALKSKLDTLRPKAPNDSKAAANMLDAQKAAEDQELKVQVAAQKHSDEEAAQFSRLSAIAQDSRALRKVIQAGLGEVSQALAAARDSVGS